MSKTASMVMKIIGASLAFAAFVCLLIEAEIQLRI